MELNQRKTPMHMTPDEFRKLGHHLVDELAMYLDALPDLPITQGKTVEQIREALGQKGLPGDGSGFEEMWRGLVQKLVDNSLHNGHPRFLGYIMGSPSPLGALGDLLAAMINPNMGGWNLTPIASEIEVQTVKWLAELIGYPTDCGGLLVSGGAMANYTAFLAARRQQNTESIRRSGMRGIDQELTVYCSEGTHTWVQKACDLFGHGTNSIRWIPTDENQRVIASDLEARIKGDKEKGMKPFLVIGTAGTVSTGGIDPLDELADICDKYDLWFHVDGAYGAPAACVPELKDMFSGMERADSIALDPHKWLYAPIEAGCVLVRSPQHLLNAYSYRPPYYHFDEESGINYYEYGFQNSRGFRALKVWLNLQKAGLKGYQEMILQDVRLAEKLAAIIREEPELELKSQNLSIVNFRFVPDPEKYGKFNDEALNELNEKLMSQAQAGGKAYFTNAFINGQFLLRTCIVNFRTDSGDIRAVADIVLEKGRTLIE